MKPVLRLVACAALFLHIAQAAAPVIDDIVPASPARVAPVVPVGKTLLVPVTADGGGSALTYKATSSNVNILVRVKTGNPTLRMNIDHASGGPADPAFAGTLDFMLFRDWLPSSSGFVGGMTQAGFYDGVIFHRIEDLGGGVGTSGVIVQGGDPNGTGGGGPGMTGGDGTTAWKFQNEFHPGTMFTGRGQLAMANAGTTTGYSLGAGGTLLVPDYLDTNGSQFFITDGQPRHLDFKHNIFGQLLRGWELLPSLKATKTVSGSRPDKELKITTASVIANETDAVLVISSKGLGSSVITVTATNAGGQSASKTFTVTAVADETNDRPYIRRLDVVTAEKDMPSVFGLEVIDLEFDYLDIQHSLLPLSASVGPKGTLLTSSGRIAQVRPTAGYVGPIKVGFGVRQFNVGGGGFEAISDSTVGPIAIGDRAVRGEPVEIAAQPGVSLINANVARLVDTDTGGSPGNFTARINWGDGTPLSTGAVARDPAVYFANQYVATGSHVYARAGVYPVVVTFFGDNGAGTSVKSTATVTAAALRAVGKRVQFTGARATNRVVASFTDSTPLLPNQYTATIDWGDGGGSAGVISRDAKTGEYLVRGTHGYRDSEPFTVRVRIHKAGAAPSSDVFAWATAEPAFVATPHLPPFPHGKLTIAWNSGPTKVATGLPGPTYAARAEGVFVIINSGNRDLGASQLRFWLSNDRVLNKSGPNRDTPLVINGKPVLDIIPFPAGAGGSGDFVVTLPKGEGAGGKFLIAEAVYTDPIADGDGSDKVIVSGPLPASIRIDAAANLRTTEARAATGGGPLQTATFKVTLDTPPKPIITSLATVLVGAPAVIRTATPHGLTDGATVTITGVTGMVPEVNGPQVITLVDANTFTIPVSVTTAGVGGAMVKSTTVTRTITSMIPGAAVTFNTMDAHGFVVGDMVTISGVTGAVPAVGGTYKVTKVPSPTSFTIALKVTTAGTGGVAARTFATTFPLVSALGGPATFHTAADHGLTTGDQVTIAGVAGSLPDVNGLQTVTKVDARTFTVPVNLATAGTGGRMEVATKVTIPLESSLPAEGLVSPAQLVFDSTNWSTPQLVTVSGVDDAVLDGNKLFKITLKAAVSADPVYSGLTGGDVFVTNLDNETATP
ncbi:MAG: peptidylprolyl isomerase [Chthoniobacteraceae bacterium]